MTHQRHRLTHRGNVHIVQQHYIGLGLDSLSHLGERFTLDLNLEQVLSSTTSCRDSLYNTTSSFDMVIFNQHAIAQAIAVILPTAQAHSFLLQTAQTRRRLARIKNACLCSFDSPHTTSSAGRDSRKMAQEIQSHTLSTQYRTCRTAQLCQ